MTQEEKAKRYDEALHKAKNYYSTTDSSSDIKLIGLIFPELKESDYEKIRKALVEMVHDTTGDSLWIDYNVHKEDALAWLEKQGEHANFRNKIQIGDKVTHNEDGVLVNISQLNRIAKKRKNQGEQNPAEWSEEDENGLGDALWAIQQARTLTKDENDMGNLWYAENWLKSIKDRVQPKPKQEWSEKDKRILNSIIQAAENHCFINLQERNWLKSLRPQSQWKPSDEQMKALKSMINIVDRATSFDARLFRIVESFYKQLKAL